MQSCFLNHSLRYLRERHRQMRPQSESYSCSSRYIKMLKIIRTVKMDIPTAASGTIESGEGIGVGVKMGLINSKSNFQSSFQNGLGGLNLAAAGLALLTAAFFFTPRQII